MASSSDLRLLIRSLLQQQQQNSSHQQQHQKQTLVNSLSSTSSFTPSIAENILEEVNDSFRFKIGNQHQQLISLDILNLCVKVSPQFASHLSSSSKWMEKIFKTVCDSINRRNNDDDDSDNETGFFISKLLSSILEWAGNYGTQGFLNLVTRLEASYLTSVEMTKIEQERKQQKEQTANDSVRREPSSSVISSSSAPRSTSSRYYNQYGSPSSSTIPSLDVIDQFLLEASADAAALEFSLRSSDDTMNKNDDSLFQELVSSCNGHFVRGNDFYSSFLENSNNEGNNSRSNNNNAQAKSQLQSMTQKLGTLLEFCSNTAISTAPKASNNNNSHHREEQKHATSSSSSQKALLELLESERKENAALKTEMEKRRKELIELQTSRSVSSISALPAPPPPSTKPRANNNNTTATVVSQAQQQTRRRLKNKIRESLLQLKYCCLYLRQSVTELQKESKINDAVLDQNISRFSSASGNDAQIARALYHREVALRKHYYNLVQDLKGQIRVYCRIRPSFYSNNDCETDDDVIVHPTSSETLSVITDRGTEKRFEFDAVFGPDSTQKEVFEDIYPLIDSALDGFNICIFAYGMSGSGKTFTMVGDASNKHDAESFGVNRRALSRLFEAIRERSQRQEERSTVTMSAVEIYLEKIRDLLVSPDEQQPSYQVSKTSDGFFYVPNLAEAALNSMEDVDQVMGYADENRTTASTLMNEQSSRSHMVVQITVSTTNMQTGERSFGKLSLIDLAGSERLSKSGATGQRAKEAAKINSSLSALGDVIAALSVNAKHVPYRNSTLTQLLTDSLGGRSKVLMICCVSPSESDRSETLSSLNFATRARGVALGKVSKNV